MIRSPLRPLARILKARAQGENPDAIARENLRLRHEAMRDKSRLQAEGRLLIMGATFICLFALIGTRMGVLASTETEEPRQSVSEDPIFGQRADILDRNGRILATNLDTYSLYAQPQQMVEPIRAATELAAIFPELDQARLVRDFTGERRFVWVRRQISPEQMAQVMDIGDPGLLFGPREMRLYPNGPIASHILGGASYGREDVASAEVIGVAGVERQFDAYLRDPANQGAPLDLSIDLTVQAAMEEVLAGGMALMNAKGAAGIIMDVDTGEIVAMASLPDFDPNKRPAPLTSGDAADSPLFNRAVQGVYELGSVFKIFAVAQALELGLVTPDTIIDTQGPIVGRGYRITDFRNYGPTQTVTNVIVKSSNIGTIRIIQRVGPVLQQAFLRSLGFMEATRVELIEGPTAVPRWPNPWPEISMMTIAYGHGISSSPLQLAQAYAAIANGGTRVYATLLKRDTPQNGPRVLSEAVAAQAREMLRQVVIHGTATLADVPGYELGGKTGTADKPSPNGGYLVDTVIATFAGMFPISDPRYVIIVMLDEPVETSGSEPRRTAGWTAAPVTAEIIRRVAPLLGMRPSLVQDQPVAVSLASDLRDN